MKSKNPPEKKNDFFERVYRVTRKIPYGRVSSYGALARYLGTGQSARTVGWALNCCHTHPHFVPAHRVVNREGLLSGRIHFGTPTAMQQMLENEGIQVEDNQVCEFEKLFWDPSRELKNRKQI